MNRFLTIPWVIYGMETFTLHVHGSDMKIAFSLFLLIPNSPVQASLSCIPLTTTRMNFLWNSGQIWRVLLLYPLTTLAAQTEKWTCVSFGIKLDFGRPSELESGFLSFLRPFHIDDHWKCVCSFLLLNKYTFFSWRKSSIILKDIFYFLPSLSIRHF